jgi:hypothetical protein
MICASCGKDKCFWTEMWEMRIHKDAPKRPRCFECIEKIEQFLEEEEKEVFP